MSYSSFHSLKHQVSNLDSALFFLVFCWNIIALQCYISFYSIAKWSHTYQFSHSVVFNFMRSQGLQHARLTCPSPTLESAQIHVCQISDAIQLSHPLWSPSHPTFTLIQHQGLFKWISSSHQVAKALEIQLQHQSFQWIVKTDFL